MGTDAIFHFEKRDEHGAWVYVGCETDDALKDQGLPRNYVLFDILSNRIAPARGYPADAPSNAPYFGADPMRDYFRYHASWVTLAEILAYEGWDLPVSNDDGPPTCRAHCEQFWNTTVPFMRSLTDDPTASRLVIYYF
ncbi:MAG: hypothetical protein GC159_21605 [Phycisphaera sp.]|nr:hypothetical protein [Phycisphaera sp.]